MTVMLRTKGFVGELSIYAALSILTRLEPLEVVVVDDEVMDAGLAVRVLAGGLADE
jgi:hypothetical protein